MSLVSSLQARGSGRIVPTARRNGELKIVLADDHPIVRQGLLALLAANPSIVVAAGCANGREALGAIREHRPNIAILDVRMPEMSGVKVLCEVMREHLPTRIILLTASIADEELLTAMRQGVSGVILKDQAADELLACLDGVAAGGRWLPRQLVAEAQQRQGQNSGPRAIHFHRLTVREQEIVSHVSLGLSNKGIAERVGLSEGTIKVHLRNIFDKLEVTSRTAVVALALQADPRFGGAQNHRARARLDGGAGAPQCTSSDNSDSLCR
jgi:DNA-binding NarL/FixJ family response regulator